MFLSHVCSISGEACACRHRPRKSSFNSSNQHIITAIPEVTRDKILLRAAASNPIVAQERENAYAELVKAETRKVTDFDHLSKSAWYTLNVSYQRLSDSRKCDMAGEAYAEVLGCIESIDGDCPSYASYGTKKSALETLWKIGKSICLSSNDMIGREVVKCFQEDGTLEKTMLGIAGSLKEQEREMFMRDGEFEGKIRELDALGHGQCIFERLDNVRTVLMGESVDEDEEEEEGGDDSEGNESDDACKKIPLIVREPHLGS